MRTHCHTHASVHSHTHHAEFEDGEHSVANLVSILVAKYEQRTLQYHNQYPVAFPSR